MRTEIQRSSRFRRVVTNKSLQVFAFFTVDMTVGMRLNHHFNDLSLPHLLFVSAFTGAAVAVYMRWWRANHTPD